MNLLDLCDDVHLLIGDKLAIHQRTLHRKNMHNFSYMVRHFLHTYRRTKWDNYANLRTFLPFRQHSYGRACEYRRHAHHYYWGDGLRKETILHSKMSRMVSAALTPVLCATMGWRRACSIYGLCVTAFTLFWQ